MLKPTVIHLEALIHLLKYLKATQTYRLFYPVQKDLQLKAYSDADWANCRQTRQSITGFCVFTGKSIISWKSKKQSTVRKSSVEAEYRSLATTACESKWISYLFRDFQLHLQLSIHYTVTTKQLILLTTKGQST